jgi:sterol desaturase/sphingolipid hydroxylase (fatty acid hydroxylase superfamily)
MDGLYILVGTLGFFIVTFLFVIVMRYFSYRETLSLAEKGLVRPDRMRGSNGKDTLRWGIVITAVGMALCVGLYPLGLLPGNTFPLGLGPWMLAGLLPTFFGLGLILIYVLTQEKNYEKPRPPSKTEPKPPLE